MSVNYPPERQEASHEFRVICVKWGDKYDDDYVLKLQAMCARHLPAHEFVCVTEKPVDGVQCNPLVCDLPGWWQKVGLFQPGMFPGNNLYLDLDVVITASLSSFFAALLTDAAKLWTLDDFSYSLRRPKQVSDQIYRTLGGIGTINSSVMLWRGWHGSEVYRVWETFEPDVMEELHGDQNHITRALWPDSIRFLPDGFAQSYKYGQRQKAPIVIFHGDPKPADVNDEWVRENWAA